MISLLLAATVACPWQVEVLNAAALEIERDYVIEDTAHRLAEDLRSPAIRGRYARFCEDRTGFARSLENDLKARDAHFSFEGPRAGETAGASPAPADWVAEWRAEGERTNAGVRAVEVLDGNIGYLRIASFHSFDLAEPKLRAALQFLSGVDGLIVDLRQNGGGSGETAGQVAASLQAPGARPVTAEETRRGRRVEDPVVPVLPLVDPSIPLVLLVDRRTASAAEAIAWSLRGQGRAYIVGDRTYGAAHATGGPRHLPHGFALTVPEARPVDLRTGESWERVGVTPDERAGEQPIWAAVRYIERQKAERSKASAAIPDEP